MENGGQKFFFSLSKKLVLSIIVVKLDFMCQIQKMYYGYFSISINFRPQYLVFTAIPWLVRVMRSKKIPFALSEFALIEVEYM